MRAFTLSVVLLLGSMPLAARADAASDAAFVTAAYQALLNRPADSSAAQGFGSATRRQIVATILGSQEYRAREVAALYQAFLHRPVDGGASSFVTLLANGSPLSLDADVQVAAAILGSPEYFAKNGSANPSFVNAVYHDLLHRVPNSTEVSAQLQYLSQIAASAPSSDAARRQFAASVLGSAEGKNDLIGLLLPAVSPPSGANLVAAACSKLECSVTAAPIAGVPANVRVATKLTLQQAYVDAAFNVILGRPADALGLASFSAQLGQGTTRRQIVQYLESSHEFRTHEVNFLYKTFLGRPADSQGIVLLTNLLDSKGLSAAALAIVGSPEYFSKRGNATNAGFVDNVYLDALGRHPAKAELATWLDALSGGTSRQAVASHIVTDAALQDAMVKGVLHGSGAPAGATLVDAALAEIDNALK